MAQVITCGMNSSTLFCMMLHNVAFTWQIEPSGSWVITYILAHAHVFTLSH